MKRWTKFLGLVMMAFVLSFAFKTGASAAKVTGVTQTKGERNSIAIKWKEVSGAFQYQYTLTESVTKEVKKGESFSPSTVVYNLSTGKTYLLTVMAHSGGDILASASDAIEVTTAPETKGYSVSQSNVTAKTVTMTAVGADGANYYVVRNGSEVVAHSDSATIKVTGLKPNTSYEFNVFAARRSAAGFVAEGSFSTCSVKTLDAGSAALTTPKASEFGVSEKSVNSSNSYTFFVKGAEDADGYELQFQDMNGKVKKTENTTSMNPVSVRSLINGNFYKYRVRTYVYYGTLKKYSGWSAFKYIGTVKKASAKRAGNALKLSWGAVSGAKSYVIYASVKKNSGFKKLSSVTAKSLKVTKVGGKALKKGTKYYFRIFVNSKDGKKAAKSSVYKALTGSL